MHQETNADITGELLPVRERLQAEITLGPTPNHNWGSAEADRPPSESVPSLAK